MPFNNALTKMNLKCFVTDKDMFLYSGMNVVCVFLRSEKERLMLSVRHLVPTSKQSVKFHLIYYRCGLQKAVDEEGIS
jgi:hypothetical protein